MAVVLAVNLGLTVALEGLAMLLLFRRKRLVYESFLCNLLTNPLVNVLLLLAVNLLGTAAYLPTVIFLEVCVVLGEALLYRKLECFKLKKALPLSLFLNGISYGVGLLLNPSAWVLSLFQ